MAARSLLEGIAVERMLDMGGISRVSSLLLEVFLRLIRQVKECLYTILGLCRDNSMRSVSDSDYDKQQTQIRGLMSIPLKAELGCPTMTQEEARELGLGDYSDEITSEHIEQARKARGGVHPSSPRVKYLSKGW